MLTKSGVKLLDFGLAKWRAPVAGSADSVLPTRDLTVQGAIVGTLAYMAPEQLEGKEADSRADLWALGVVVYEMVTGKKAFGGKSAANGFLQVRNRRIFGLLGGRHVSARF
jgi:serine/threonine-protein kinase